MHQWSLYQPEFKLESVVLRFDIERKLITITTDNAPNDTSSIASLERKLNLVTNFPHKFLHFKCLARVINLGIRNCIKRIDDVVDPIKQVANSIRSSWKGTDTFNISTSLGLKKRVFSIQTCMTWH